ncbi:MAG: transcriptional regulator NrdR [Candidatus Pacearchaeota archaeon]
MKCIYCGHKETKVTNKRDINDFVRRRRECLRCKKRFTTYEKAEIDLIVIKKDGRREKFNREKLRNGILKACEKRPIAIEKIDKVIAEIEEELRKRGKEIKTKIIGEIVMKKLKKLDKIAYIRFASVYREFKDISDFKNVMKEV